MDPEPIVLVFTAVPDLNVGERLVKDLVDERVIACGSVLGEMTSIYRWGGEVRREGERLVILKTRRERVPELFARVTELHPYEVPELVALRAEAVAEAYARWLREETTEVLA